MVLSSCLPRFPPDRHFDRCRARRQVHRHFRWALDPSFSLAIADLLAVGLYLRSMLDILLRLDHRQRMPEALVLDNGGVADTLVLAEDTVGKRVTFPSDLQSAVREVIKIKILTARPLNGQLLADVALFTVTEDIVQSGSNDVESAVQVLGVSSSIGFDVPSSLGRIHRSPH
jgi:hypothetical protein